MDAAEHNRRVIEQLRDEIGIIEVPREMVRRIIDEGREEHTRELMSRISKPRPQPPLTP